MRINLKIQFDVWGEDYSSSHFLSSLINFSSGSPFQVAKRRFKSLEQRFSKDDAMRRMYHRFMKEDFDFGQISFLDNMQDSSISYRISVFCDFRVQHRVVFYASCRTSLHVSLNNFLIVVSTIHEEQHSTLIRFRYETTVDIGKMYHQVLNIENNYNFRLSQIE